MTARIYDELVLAIRPTPRGFAYALFEAPLSPVDWGVTEVPGKHKNKPTRDAVSQLIKKYRPDTLVIEDRTSLAARRYGRVGRLQKLLAALARDESIELARYSRSRICKAFHHEKITRYEIAQAIAAFIPAFEKRLPPLRKSWQGDDPRIWIFDAASLAMTHFAAVAGAEPP
jgi:hypothetical protein